MKKVFLVGLGLVILLSFTGCGGKSASLGPGLGPEIRGELKPGGEGIQVPAASSVKHSYGLSKPGLLDLFSDDDQVAGLQYMGSNPTPTPTLTTGGGSNSSVVWGTTSQSAISQNADRMIVRTGNIEMVVDEIAGSLAQIKQIAAKFGGYVVSLQQWKEGDRNIGSISIRVLAADYENALSELRGMAKNVTNESSNSQDVTEEYTDQGAQLKNLEATETQLLKIMETAAKTDDILSIQRELTGVRGQIEQIKGRLLFLERTSASSLIDIKLEEAVLALKFSADKISAGAEDTVVFTPEVVGGFAPYNYFWDFGDGKTSFERNPSHSYKNPGVYPVGLKVTDDKGYTNTVVRNSYINIVSSWKPNSVARNAWSGFVTFGKGFVNVLIWLAAFSPVWIIAGVAVWYFVFFRRRHKKNPW
jgi:PKD repeat protein